MEQSPIINAVKKVSPAVVSIIITKHLPQVRQYYLTPFGGDTFGGDPFEEFWGPFGFPMPPRQKPMPPQRPEKIRIGGGSGFIISKDGLVLTNRHVVVDPGAEYTVVTSDDKKYQGKVLARDPINDVAIIKIDGKNLPTVELGDSSNLQLGQTAIAIGNALGTFRNTVSRGVISGLSRSITATTGLSGQVAQLRGLIQTDAAINPGNSGGPLVDIEGKVIGINTAIVLGAQSIGFAIPINSAKKDIVDLENYGRIILPMLGVRYILINKELQKHNHLPVDYGALVIREQAPGDFAVVPGSAADKAGVQEYDIILEFNGVKIDEKHPLQDLIQKCKVGEEVKLKILRGDQEIILTARLEERK